MLDSDSLSDANSATDQILRWLLLSGNRLSVTVAFTVLIFIVFLVFEFAGIVCLKRS